MLLHSMYIYLWVGMQKAEADKTGQAFFLVSFPNGLISGDVTKGKRIRDN